MNDRRQGTITITLTMAAILTLGGAEAFAAKGKQASPELAAKKEMVRKQQEQRITNEKRKAAADNLKAERLRVYKAKEAVKQSNPSAN